MASSLPITPIRLPKQSSLPQSPSLELDINTLVNAYKFRGSPNSKRETKLISKGGGGGGVSGKRRGKGLPFGMSSGEDASMRYESNTDNNENNNQYSTSNKNNTDGSSGNSSSSHNNSQFRLRPIIVPTPQQQITTALNQTSVSLGSRTPNDPTTSLHLTQAKNSTSNKISSLKRWQRETHKEEVVRNELQYWKKNPAVPGESCTDHQAYLSSVPSFTGIYKNRFLYPSDRGTAVAGDYFKNPKEVTVLLRNKSYKELNYPGRSGDFINEVIWRKGLRTAGSTSADSNGSNTFYGERGGIDYSQNQRFNESSETLQFIPRQRAPKKKKGKRPGKVIDSVGPLLHFVDEDPRLSESHGIPRRSDGNILTPIELEEMRRQEDLRVLREERRRFLEEGI